MARLTLQETMDRLLLLIRAGYPVIYIVSHEETRVLDYLAKIIRIVKAENPNKHLLRWYEGPTGLEELTNLSAYHTSEKNIQWLNIEGISSTINWKTKRAQQGDEILNAIKMANNTNNPDLGDSLTVFFDLHPYLQQNASFSLVRPLRNAADALRRYYDENRNQPGKPYKTIVIIAPSASTLSMELERDLIVLDFPLPETDELRLTLTNMVIRDIFKFPEEFSDEDTPEEFSDEETRGLCDLIAGAGRGLTLEDYKRGLNMFAVRGEYLNARHVENMLDLKAKVINNQALNYTPHVDIKLGGLQGIREWIRIRQDAVISELVRKKYRLPPPKGVMLCGASGGGKSQLAKLIAKEFKLALLRLDVGSLFGKYVGEAEERTRKTLQLAEVLAPVVLWLDEIDKAFTNIGTGGDSGVSARVFGYFLTWLAEKKDSVFVVATANDFRKLLDQFPEFGRKGRFDEIFWVDLPNETERQEIFNIYLKPHFEDKHLELTDNDVSRLAAENNIVQSIQGTDVLEKFCWLLSQSAFSHNLTGAEIEHAINEASSCAYSKSQGSQQLDNLVTEQNQFTPGLIATMFKKAKDRALYEPNSPDYKVLEKLQSQARKKHWLFANEEIACDKDRKVDT